MSVYNRMNSLGSGEEERTICLTQHFQPAQFSDPHLEFKRQVGEVGSNKKGSCFRAEIVDKMTYCGL
jgi:hypothetical protein